MNCDLPCSHNHYGKCMSTNLCIYRDFHNKDNEDKKEDGKDDKKDSR